MMAYNHERGGTPKSSVVIGAGVTGLVCARALLEAGLSVVVVETSANLFPAGREARFAAELVKKFPGGRGSHTCAGTNNCSKVVAVKLPRCARTRALAWLPRCWEPVPSR